MTQLLPLRSEVNTENRPLRVMKVDGKAADPVFSVLSTQTARTLLVELYREPTTLSGLAERTDISIQNATYHLQRLKENGLVEVVDTWYSSRGKEMDVFAPTYDPLMLVVGNADNEEEFFSRGAE